MNFDFLFLIDMYLVLFKYFWLDYILELNVFNILVMNLLNLILKIIVI